MQRLVLGSCSLSSIAHTYYVSISPLYHTSMPSTKVSSLVALAAALCATSGSAFAFGGARSPQVAVVPSASSAPILSPSVLRMSDDEEGYDYPSDSSSEEHYETDKKAVDVETEGPNEVEAQVDSVFDLLPADLAAVDSMGSAKRADINEALLRLEQMNPTEEAAFSPLLNGVWTLRYAGGYSNEWALPSPTRQLALFLYSGGYSPGLFALSLAQKLPKALVELGELEICKWHTACVARALRWYTIPYDYVGPAHT